MPAFQPLRISNKRSSESSESEELLSRKRPTLGLSAEDEKIDKALSDQVWIVQWRNFQYKKHKTWDGDAIFVVNKEAEAILYDLEGKIMNSCKANLPLYEGKNFSIGSKEIELERTIPQSQYLSGICFGRGPSISSIGTNLKISRVKKFISPTINAQPQGIDFENEGDPKPSDVGSSGPKYELSHWAVNWRKPREKKNKTWDGDGYVTLTNGKLIMVSEDGEPMGNCSCADQPLYPGFKIFIGGKEVELERSVPESDLPDTKQLDSKLSEINLPETIEAISSKSSQNNSFVPPASFYAKSKPSVKGPLHDPSAPDSLVLKSPTKEHLAKYNKKNLSLVPVVVDPILSRKLRSHQREGLMFLYECVMGLRKHEGQGCILADDMGLGKTLQTITLVWTLLRQNPYAEARPVVHKVLIVCPVSLINNWKAEFHKWLGRDRLGILTCEKNNSNIDIFENSKAHQVLIIGYERLRTVIEKLAHMYPPIGLIVCDEGHRLKSANNKTVAVLKTLSTRRRVILSGTPIQNDLSEFHAMADFCNPGLLDDYNIFRKIYETPILRSRMPEASKKDIELGEARTAQLLSVAKSFVLRRDASLIKNHLPPKSEFVIFVAPTPLQLAMFRKILHPNKLDDLIQGSTAESLALINILIKISNSPILLKATADNVKARQNNNSLMVQRKAVVEALNLLPEKSSIEDLSLSGKLTFLARILKMLRQNTTEKCVLVSHYTSTLNILEAYCKKASYSYYRLDGQTPQSKRQEYVNAFNSGSQFNSFIFLLSSKAGGVGINLIGGSRLFIIDSDWNPSHDLQSMARCHRDGQKQPVFIYRLLTAGTIDEKIYQRQVTKLALSDSLIGSGATSSKSDSFTRKDLRDIFRIHLDTACNTHDLLECRCDSVENLEVVAVDEELITLPRGFVSASDVRSDDVNDLDQLHLQQKRSGLAVLDEWKHINCLKSSVEDYVQDDILRKIITDDTQKFNGVLNATEQQSRLDVLLKAVDIDTVQAMDNTRSMSDVPAGTITFLFEKCSKTNFNIVE